MPLAQLDVRGLDSEALERALPRPSAAQADRARTRVGARSPKKVSEIIEQVRVGGDRALVELTTALDGVADPVLTVDPFEIGKAARELPKALLESLEFAWERLVAYHRHQAGRRQETYDDAVVLIDELVRPVERAGLYAPGGRALYPSSVLMCAARRWWPESRTSPFCVPPARDGRVAPVVLAAARVAGIAEVHPIGGAQAIAAMTFGTESVRRVDVVVGPGNQYVAEAKRQVAGSVGVAAAFAGPSEVVVVADGSSPAAWAAIDLGRPGRARPRRVGPFS